MCVPHFSEGDEYKDDDASDADGDGDGDRYVDVDERARRPTQTRHVGLDYFGIFTNAV